MAMTSGWLGAIKGESGTRTVADRSNRNINELPEELRHEDILLFRDMGNEFVDSYQIVFDQHFMPYDYDVPDGFELQHARTEWHGHESSIRRMLGGEKECICIVVSEQAEVWRERVKECFEE